MSHLMNRRQIFCMAGTSAAGARSLARMGTVRFCRIANGDLREVALAIAGRGVVVEVDPSATGMTFLGSHATVVLDRRGCHLFSPTAL